jgi:hypothetical protein
MYNKDSLLKLALIGVVSQLKCEIEERKNIATDSGIPMLIYALLMMLLNKMQSE